MKSKEKPHPWRSPMSSEHLFIVNPIAGKGRALKVLDKIRSIIGKPATST